MREDPIHQLRWPISRFTGLKSVIGLRTLIMFTKRVACFWLIEHYVLILIHPTTKWQVLDERLRSGKLSGGFPSSLHRVDALARDTCLLAIDITLVNIANGWMFAADSVCYPPRLCWTNLAFPSGDEKFITRAELEGEHTDNRSLFTRNFRWLFGVDCRGTWAVRQSVTPVSCITFLRHFDGNRNELPTLGRISLHTWTTTRLFSSGVVMVWSTSCLMHLKVFWFTHTFDQKAESTYARYGHISSSTRYEALASSSNCCDLNRLFQQVKNQRYFTFDTSILCKHFWRE